MSELYTFPTSSTIKLTCTTIAMASKAKDGGVFLFNFFVPPSNIHMDEFINIIMCYKCYAYDSHYAYSCPKPEEFKVCSLCAGSNHTYKQCSAQTKTCINCGGPHNTMALSCPYRKKLLKDKRTATSGQSFADAVKSSRPNVSAELSSSANEIIAKSVMSIVVSAMKNAEAPGTFADTMNHLLKANNLPKFTLGGISPPTVLNPNQWAEQGASTSSSPSNETRNRSLDIVSDGTERTVKATAVADSPVAGGAMAYRQSTASKIGTIYRKKTTTVITPSNVANLYSRGDIVIECSTSNEIDFIRQLASVTPGEFGRLVRVMDLKDTAHDRQAINDKAGSNSRSLRSKASSNSRSN